MLILSKKPSYQCVTKHSKVTQPATSTNGFKANDKKHFTPTPTIELKNIKI